MKFWFLIILLITCFNYVFCAVNVDSLKASLLHSDEINQVKIMIQIATACQKSDVHQASDYAAKAELLAVKLGLPAEVAISRKVLGNINYIQKKYPQAIKFYLSALNPALASKDISLQGDIYYNLGRAYTDIKDLPKAEFNLQKSLALRKRLPKRADEIDTLNNLGHIYWEMQNFGKSVTYFQSAVDLFDESVSPKQAATIYNNLGNSLLKNGSSEKALDAYIKSLRLKETYGTDTELASANLNLGNLYYTNGNLTKAIEHYETAQKLYQQAGNTSMEAMVNANLGAVYNDMEDFEQAMQKHLNAFEYFRKSNMISEMAKTLNNIGNIYLKKKNYPEAIQYYQKSLELKRELNDKEGLSTSYNNLSEIDIQMGNLQSAMQNALKSLEFAQLTKDKAMQIKNYVQLSKIYASLGNYKKAYEALEKYRALDLDVYQEEGRNVLKELMVRFDTEEKSKEINKLKTAQQIQQEKTARHMRILIGLALLSVTILTILLFILSLYRSKRSEVIKRIAIQAQLEQLNHDLEARIEQALAEYKIQQQIIVQKTKMESLGTLAAGVAHEINQPLSAITMSIDNIQNKMNKQSLNDDYLQAKCENMQNDILRIRQIIDHIRLFSRDQKDSLLERVEINRIVENAVSLSEHDLSKSRIKTDLCLHQKPLFIVGNRFKLEQVLLNLISNAMDAIEEKYHGAEFKDHHKQLSIKTDMIDKLAIIEVADNGCGMSNEVINKIFDPFFTTKDPDQGTGLGLSISYGIISEMDGDISIDSVLGQGTRTIVKLPLLEEKG